MNGGWKEWVKFHEKWGIDLDSEMKKPKQVLDVNFIRNRTNSVSLLIWCPEDTASLLRYP